MDKQEQLEDLLVDWRLQRQQGNELSAEELCTDNPEFVPELSKMISQLKEMDWLEDDDDPENDFLHLPDFSTVSGHADETRLPECKLSLDEFCQRLIDSELMDEEKVGTERQRIPADDARSFAVRLVEDKKLTRFQAVVLLECRDIPLVLDRYVLLGEIGKGGMGAVYKALHQQMDRVVALKILPKEAVDSPEKVKRFHREVKAAAKLTHQNIVVAHDAREDKGFHFLVMELIAGSDLSDVVRKQGPVSCAKAVDYLAQAARGLDHAHGMGIVHRDIKPGNLLLGNEGKVKILDMGLARIDGGDPEHDKTMSMELTQSGMVMGTIAYLAPEQAMDTRTADARSDVYSLGCTLYYLLMGKVIYREDTMMKTIMAHREGAIPSLRDERESVPAELDKIFQKMVAKKPEDRFQSMADVISALKELDIKDEEGTQPVVAEAQAYHDTATFIDTSREAVAQQTTRVKQPPGRNRNWIATFLAAAAGFVILAGIITIATKKGTVTIDIADRMKPGVEVKIKTVNGDKEIAVLDKSNNWTATLYGGEYSIDLNGGNDEFKLKNDTLTVSRFGQNFVKIDYTPNTTDNLSLDKSGDWYGWPKDAPPPAIAPFNAKEAKAHQLAWATHLGVPVEYTNSIGMNFRLIPPGEFLMGSTPREIEAALATAGKVQRWRDRIKSEAPQHQVILTRPIYVGVTEVTQAQYKQVMGSNPSQFSATGKVNDFVAGMDTGNHPVEWVSWNDAAEYCAKLSQHERLKPFYVRSGEIVTPLNGTGYRLPTEAEWEYACRAGTTTQFWSGDDEKDLIFSGWIGGHSAGGTRVVGKLQTNPFGLADVHGNVWEWVQDSHNPTFYNQFKANPAIDPSSPFVADSTRVFRGGARNHDPSDGRSSTRQANGAMHRSGVIGFRVALPVDAVKNAVRAEQINDSSTDYALQFDGKDDYIEVDVSKLSLRRDSQITFEAWVSDSKTTSVHQHIVTLQDLANPAKPQSMSLRVQPKEYDGTISAHWELGDGAYHLERSKLSYESYQSNSRRIHLAAVFDCGNMKARPRIYVNGQVVGDYFKGKLKLLVNNNDLTKVKMYIGGEPNQRAFIGRIYGVRISSGLKYRKEFTPQRKMPKEEDTLALFDFSTEQGNVVKDSSGNGHDGKIVGAKWVRVGDELKVIAEPSAYNWPKDKPTPAIAPFIPEEAKQLQEAWAKHLEVPVEMENSIGMKFRVIPPGEFMMGSSEEEIAKLLREGIEKELGDWYALQVPKEGPQHRVILTKPIGLAIHEVTRGQFRQFVEATGYRTDAEKDGKGGYGYENGQRVQAPEFLWNTNLGFETEQTDDHPVLNVSWNDAVAYCEWLSEKERVVYRLPTEAEWEFSCRAGNVGRYSCGDDESKLADVAWFGGQGGGNTKSVGQKASNPFGLFDMHGNVWEWCRDGFGLYNAANAIDPVGTSQAETRVLHGGAFYGRPSSVRSANRAFNQPDIRDNSSGFRVARSFEKYEPKKPRVERPAGTPQSDENSKLESSETGEGDKKLGNE